jgi:LacI family transcriptional regulator
MPTIRDVAGVAGVSSTTVSRVLAEDPTLTVPAATRERVLAAARELAYVPRVRRGTAPVARPRPGTAAPSAPAGGVVYSFAGVEEQRDPYYASIRRGIEAACLDASISLDVIPFRRGSAVRLPAALDHVIAVGRVGIDATRAALAPHQRLVAVDDAPDVDRHDSVVVDFARATEAVLAHLEAAGHQRIGFVGGSADGIVDARQVHFERLMRLRGRWRPEDVHVGLWSPEAPDAGYHLMRRAIEQGGACTAYFVASDPMAAAAMKALDELGIRVPDDVAVVGFDDEPMSMWLRPALTTVRVHTEQMGRSAVDLLLQRRRGRRVPLQVVVPTELVVRQSSGPYHRHAETGPGSAAGQT